MIEWRVIPGFERYEASTDGRVRNAETGREIRPCPSTNGYLRLCLRYGEPVPNKHGKQSRAKGMKVHRLIAMAFIPNPDNLPQVNHKDLNKHNNVVSNLEWVSHRQNQEHAAANGKYDAVLSEERRRKLTPDEVVALRAMRNAGAMLSECAAQFGICSSVASKICRGRAWPSLPGAVDRHRLIKRPKDYSALHARILSVLPTHALEASRRLGENDTTIFKHLARMEKAGMVVAHWNGRRKIFSACFPSKESGA